MPRYFHTIYVWLFTSLFFARAQNFVPNYSFETLKKPVCKAVTSLILNDNISNYTSDWVSPTGGTSDLHLNTGPDSCTANLDKYGLTSHSGNACAGIFTLGTPPSAGLAPYREYLQVRLKTKLTVGKIYYVELYVSPFDVKYERISSCYSNNLGCYFSADSIYKSLGAVDQTRVLPFKPQVNETHIISNPHQWHKISGCFTATEAAKYLTIGNFFDDLQTDYVEVDSRKMGAYYFVDDVSVIETNLTALPILSLNDTTLCPNQPFSVHLANNPQIIYQWQDGSTSSTYTIKQAGVYSVTATSGPCLVTDTFTVTQEAALQLPIDTTLCRGSTLLISPSNPTNNPLQWSDGSRGPNLLVSASGTYWVKSESSACSQIDSIRIQVADCPGTIPNVFTPNNDGLNDTFFIDGITLTPWKLEIYNRWGSRVYQSDAYQNDWEGDGLPAGVYYYLLSSNSLQKQYKGWVQVMR